MGLETAFYLRAFIFIVRELFCSSTFLSSLIRC